MTIQYGQEKTFAWWINKARINTLGICYIYRGPTATMAARTRLNVALLCTLTALL
jgi:hypothetical protein